jgi:TolA-binding protein
LRARAIYWRGEANYRLGRYESAKADYTQFMGIPGSMLLDEFSLVRYNLGYTLFNLNDYQGALTHLKNFESGVTAVRPEVLADAMNRIADCYYMTTDYQAAVTYYDRVIEYGKTDADYAMFQKGFCLGLMKNERGKTEVLTSLTVKYPSSSYLPKTFFERGRAYIVLGDFKKGETDFNTVINSFPTSPLVPQAIVQLGLLYFNMGENDKAVAQYKIVIEKYKATPEARYAMTGLKTTYVEMNDVESYFTYVRSLQGYGDVNMAEKDSLLYSSAENLYMTGRCDRATAIFENYLTEFPNGSFRLNAQFYLAECFRSSGNREAALRLYNSLTGELNNQFTEPSVIAAAELNYDLENFEAAYRFYSRLEQITSTSVNKVVSLRGQLRSAYQAADAQKTIAAATKVSSSPGMPEELTREALYMKAKANSSLNNFDEALVDFRRVASEVISSEGAEAKYRVAEILNTKGQVAEAEKVIWEFIDQQTPHQFWMARMFLLLSDISVKKGDVLQARATLISLRDNYTVEDDGILDEVRSRLAAINQNN